MGVENKVGRFRDAALVGGAAAVGLPFVDIDNTRRAITALKGGKVDYLGVVDVESGGHDFGAIVVPGAGSVISPEGEFSPNHYGRIRFDAAAIAYARGIAPRIIILHGEGSPQIATSNRAHLKEAYARYSAGKFGLPDNVVIDEATSRNTSEDMDRLSRMSDDYQDKPVLIVTSGFHSNRAVLLARAYGISAKTTAAEELVLSEEPWRTNEIHNLYKTPEMTYLRRKEWIEIAGSIWDSKAKAWTALRHADNARRRLGL